MEDIIIREARPEDAEALLAFMKQVGGETDNLTFGAEGLPITAEQERAFLAGMAEAEKSVFYCAWEGQRLVGTGSISAMSRRMGHRAELGISVEKARWGRGIGSRIMEKLIGYAKEHGIEILSLEVRSDNARAVALYEGFGFQEIGRFPGFFKIGDEYVEFTLMVLDLRG